jgi:hypothetical protein
MIVPVFGFFAWGVDVRMRMLVRVGVFMSVRMHHAVGV